MLGSERAPRGTFCTFISYGVGRTEGQVFGRGQTGDGVDLGLDVDLVEYTGKRNLI